MGLYANTCRAIGLYRHRETIRIDWDNGVYQSVKLEAETPDGIQAALLELSILIEGDKRAGRL